MKFALDWKIFIPVQIKLRFVGRYFVQYMESIS